jgi:hypothetical protein
LTGIPAKALILAGALLSAAAGALAGTSGDFVVLVESPTAAGREQEPAQAFVDMLGTQLPADSQLAIIVFDEKPHLVRPLSAVTATDGLPLPARDAGEATDTGRIDTAGALERAIYELRAHGRAGARRFIVVIGNGGIDTGNAAHDDTRNEWLREDLADESTQARIRIFWLTTSEAADYRLIQNVTRDTDGEYFRAFDDAGRRLALAALLDAVTPSQQLAPKAQAPAQAEPEPEDKTENRPPIHAAYEPAFVIGAVVLLVILTAGVTAGVFLWRNRKAKTVARTQWPGDRPQREARVELRDVSGFTGRTHYDITGKRTFIGRQPREVTQSNFVIVIADDAISRSHARIDCKDGGYWLEDTNSVNGTYVNGVRLEGSHLLRNGDKIRFAKFEFDFALPSGTDGGEGDTRTGRSPGEDYDEDRTLIRPGHR